MPQAEDYSEYRNFSPEKLEEIFKSIQQEEIDLMLRDAGIGGKIINSFKILPNGEVLSKASDFARGGIYEIYPAAEFEKLIEGYITFREMS